MSVLLIDVCHTLYSSNTTFDFLAHYFSDDPRYLRLEKRRQSVLQRVRARLLPGPDQVRADALALLEGEDQTTLVMAAREFVKSLPAIEVTHSYLQSQKSRHVAVYLVSSSLDIVVAELAQILSCDGWFASELGFDGGVCNGQLTTDLTAVKDRVIQSHFKGEQDIEFVTDNFSDANCVPLVKSFRPVFQNKDLRARAFWANKPTAEPITYD